MLVKMVDRETGKKSVVDCVQYIIEETHRQNQDRRMPRQEGDYDEITMYTKDGGYVRYALVYGTPSRIKGVPVKDSFVWNTLVWIMNDNGDTIERLS